MAPCFQKELYLAHSKVLQTVQMMVTMKEQRMTEMGEFQLDLKEAVQLQPILS